MKISRKLDDLVGDLKKFPPLTARQRENTSHLMALSDKFHTKLGVKASPGNVSLAEVIVLESGHQPNFMPHCGTWKKAFLLSRIHKKIIETGGESIAFFGFADQNLSTAKYLYRNHIPCLNNNGFDVIGFKIDEKDRLKPFCTLEKPSEAAWQKEMGRIRDIYQGYIRKLPESPEPFQTILDPLLETLWKSYERAENFAELNAFIFARICHDILGFDLKFFMYSDLQREMLFLNESERLLNRLPAYNKAYNRIIAEKNLNIPTVSPDHLPFWYHCTCGTKIDLFIDDTFTAKGVCPVCEEKHTLLFGENFNNLKQFYHRMDFMAVTRSVIVPEGIGNALFIPGSGGSMQYGEIADEIASTLAFNQPLILSWRSTDYYLGLVHGIVLRDLMKAATFSPKDLQGIAFKEKISGKLLAMSAEVALAEKENVDKKTQKILKNNLHNFTNLLESTKKIFQSTPSACDVLVNNDPNKISAIWTDTCEHAIVTSDCRMNRIDENILYPSVLFQDIAPGGLPAVYLSIREMEVSNDKKNTSCQSAH